MFVIFIVIFKGYNGFSTLQVAKADRTNGRAFVRLSPSLTLCIVAKRCVLVQKLQLTALYEVVYEKSIGTKMNYLDFLFRGYIKVMSSIALHPTLNISETVRDRRFVPKDHQLEMGIKWSPDR